MKRLILLSTLLLALPAFAAPSVTSLQPNFGPASGGTEVTITGSGLSPAILCFLPCPTTVTFGDKTVEVTEETFTRIRVNTPPHTPGTVDVRVNVPGEQPLLLPAAFTYQDVAEEGYEQVLLPLYFEELADGAGGTRWATYFRMRNNGPDPVRFAPYPCPAGQVCPPVFPLTTTLVPGRTYHGLPPAYGQPAGNPSRLFYVSRDGAQQLSFGARIADLSRDALNAGTEIPVLREDDVLMRQAQLFEVPMNPNFRVLLRLYDVAQSTSRFRVALYKEAAGDATPALFTQELTISTPQSGPFRTEAAYGQFDVTSLLNLDSVQWPPAVRIEITPLTAGSRYWAFASLTNNTTQHVTLVTPQ